jgi:Fe-S cluster assembly ATP-binding protein
MLKVENLCVQVTDDSKKEILKGVNLEIRDGETHVLLGPNGAGKSCLVMTIMGIPIYEIKRGEIFFDNEDITTLSIDERARLGIGLTFQNPPEIRGVKLGDLISLCKGDSVPDFLDKGLENRDVNIGFSGGERKKSELVQVFAMKPKLVILDEIDSGVDIESMELLGKEINSFIKNRSCLIITHQGYILKYIHSDIAHILLNGRIVHSGPPDEVLSKIRKTGFGGNKDD